MANRYAPHGDAIVSLVAVGEIGAFRTAAGKLFVPAPLDYLSWTEGAKFFVEGKDLGTDPRGLVRRQGFTEGRDGTAREGLGYARRRFA